MQFPGPSGTVCLLGGEQKHSLGNAGVLEDELPSAPAVGQAEVRVKGGKVFLCLVIQR